MDTGAEFTEELRQVVCAADEQTARDRLSDALGRRSAPGFVFLSNNLDDEPGPDAVQVRWADARHQPVPLPEGFSEVEMARQVIRRIPRVIHSWIFSRDTPIQFGRLKKFYPQIMNTAFRGLEKKHGLPPLQDLLLISCRHEKKKCALAIGLLEAPSAERVSAINMLTQAYLTRWISVIVQDGYPDDLRADSAIRLTGEELECMKWLVAGKTVSEISSITDLSQRNVRFYIDRAKDRYGYATRQQAMVRAALDYGLDPMGR